MKNYVQAFLDTYPYDEEAKREVLTALDKISQNAEGFAEINAILDAYEADKDCHFGSMLKRARAAFAKAEVGEHLGELLFCILLSKPLLGHYRAQGIPEQIFWDTMYDHYYKAVECKLVCGHYGNFVTYWFDRYYNLTRFALGRFQFEVNRFGHTYERDGLSLSPDSPVIGVHIPRSGASLTREALDESYAKASVFFKEQLGDAPIAFVCDSWLLFERHKEMLPKTAGICRFMADYDIIESRLYENYGEVWRLFDTFYEGDLSALPADTTLRRAYIELMRRGEQTGCGVGVFFYEQYLRDLPVKI
ncbi:MAG: DUF5596 domain-containing protein [Clostridia bacterium]|nr:DUF5596 domain-containing protein [Clostridia bacterium]